MGVFGNPSPVEFVALLLLGSAVDLAEVTREIEEKGTDALRAAWRSFLAQRAQQEPSAQLDSSTGPSLAIPLDQEPPA